jgi:hypothetical protein
VHVVDSTMPPHATQFPFPGTASGAGHVVCTCT